MPLTETTTGDTLLETTTGEVLLEVGESEPGSEEEALVVCFVGYRTFKEVNDGSV